MFKTYIFRYQHEGASWMLELKADSAEDAKRRLSKLQYATYDGELVAKIAASPGSRGLMPFLLNALIWLLPTFRK
jgi:hypothetical protein